MGYTKLSSFFTQYPDLFCLRRFSIVGNELILYKQAELAHLERDLNVLHEKEAVESRNSWYIWASDSKTPIHLAKQAKFKEFDEKLRIYQEDILRLAQLEVIARPSSISLKSIIAWLARPECGAGFLKGTEARPWSMNTGTSDLLCIAKQPDALDLFFIRTIGPLWHAVIRPLKTPVDEEKGLGKDALWWYPNNHFTRLANVICVFVSAAIPSASLWALFKVASLNDRLVMITIFTFVFSAVVLLGFGLRRADTFAVTVAFAAIQVVFLDGARNAH